MVRKGLTGGFSVVSDAQLRIRARDAAGNREIPGRMPPHRPEVTGLAMLQCILHA
jgi:hypothetical protein